MKRVRRVVKGTLVHEVRKDSRERQGMSDHGVRPEYKGQQVKLESLD